jgi:hypothetical protein
MITYQITVSHPNGTRTLTTCITADAAWGTYRGLKWAFPSADMKLVEYDDARQPHSNEISEEALIKRVFSEPRTDVGARLGRLQP